MKSRNIRTTEPSVLHKVIWPEEMVYTTMGKPAEYDGLTIPLIFRGYLVVMVVEKTSVHPLMIQHLQDLMSDVELYGWEPSITYGSSSSNKVG